MLVSVKSFYGRKSRVFMFLTICYSSSSQPSRFFTTPSIIPFRQLRLSHNLSSHSIIPIRFYFNSL